MSILRADEKETASLTFADLVRRTSAYFPDPAYRPKLLKASTVNAQYGINAGAHMIFANSDGTGTKPELAERLFDADGNYDHFENPAFDLVAMVADDVARNGAFVVGIVNSLDVNAAHPDFIAALARGLEKACAAGRFPLLNGETAELGYRSPGWGTHRLNWNAVALQLVNADKLIDGSKLRPGQPIVGLREKSIRSNGLTRARAILEQAYIRKETPMRERMDAIAWLVRHKVGGVSDGEILKVLKGIPNADAILEHVQLPWHTAFPDLTRKLMQPSTIYAPLVHEAQGGVDGEVNIPLVACAHVSGGGIPLKVKRMLEKSGLGAQLGAVFPDPEGIPELIELEWQYQETSGQHSLNQRKACEQWNRGLGFVMVTENADHAGQLTKLAADMGYEAAQVGEVTDRKAIEWRGHLWTY